MLLSVRSNTESTSEKYMSAKVGSISARINAHPTTLFDLGFNVPPITDEAVCIRHWDYSETSQTVALFTREHGIVRALAKGSRRPKSPYSGGIELLTRGEMIYLERRSGLHLLTSWDLRELYPTLRRSLDAHRAGLYICELIYLGVNDLDPHPRLYDETTRALRALSQDEQERNRLLTVFQWWFLSETGFRPYLGEDCEAEEKSEHTTVRFSPTAGGLVDDTSAADHAWNVRPSTIRVLQCLERAAELPLDSEPQSVRRASRLLAAYIRHVLGREPNTFQVVFGQDIPR